jgi:hypothetical protein
MQPELRCFGTAQVVFRSRASGKDAEMETMLIEDPHGRYSVTIQTDCVLFDDALRDPNAEPIFGLATHAIVSTILQGGSWPEELTTRLADYMRHMKDHVVLGEQGRSTEIH